ncbi:MAG: SHOCT domain-containing protein [Chloroflexi bacterium]|jgi:uncharacterized membrane protein|nr:SHOCT domain-containing protein [Chloroflexota bacterium]MBT4073331.1 SHOCT domain-containing protein [Chloroflexota bacterium]MBT4514996.1 SHOCT domain-containing protein [Chloroflexota bacterium]MBT6681531.1 SHOCT domain-containing protein [Chloroflexota bacterium]
MMWGNHDGQGWWMVWGLIVMAIFWGGVVWALYFGFRSQRAGDNPLSNVDLDPKEIAARRYAGGEIDEDEYDRIMNRIAG